MELEGSSSIPFIFHVRNGGIWKYLLAYLDLSYDVSTCEVFERAYEYNL